MHSTKNVRWALLLLTTLLACTGVSASETDDYVPEVTDRVARISFVHGDVQIRRADRQDWEVVVVNLPIVEGDEIATDGNGRFEIQFNSYTHLRVAENSQIRIVGLQDAGIAISVPLGTVSLRTAQFSSSGSYFEIDAPKTTVSVQKPGVFKVEAGVQDSIEVFVSASDGGEARVYSADAGFTVKNGRRAKIYIAGNQTGEWESDDVSQFIDEFDRWTLDRDAVIAKRLADAHYDRYYDRDMYGAEELNDYGEWVHTRKYGYVWRPYRTSISNYSDWSPYRYGHWRWIPPYGWTWVNDEPWGWATYHHGRWVWDNGVWYWTPYAQYRNRRSWWYPALVVVRIIRGNVCWYPLGYGSSYYDYNSHYYSSYGRRRRHHGNGNNQGGNPSASPTPVTMAIRNAREPRRVEQPAPASPGLPLPPTQTTIRNAREGRVETPSTDVPPGGVVTVPVSEFGRGKGRFTTPPLSVATSVLTQADNPAPVLPTYADLNGKVSSEIRSVRAPMIRTNMDVPIGATPRKSDAPLDQELQKTRILGGRPPLQRNETPKEPGSMPAEDGPRKTGAVGRPIIVREEAPVKQAPKQDRPIFPPPSEKQDAPVEIPKNDGPIFAPPRETKRDTPREDRSPKYDPPRETKRDSPRVDRSPKYDPPTKRDDPPRYDPPPKRFDPPPRNDPPPKSDPPPAKVDKPERKGKDGR